MSELFPGRGPRDESRRPEPTSHLDPRLEREEARRGWEIRTAQWRVLLLAEAAFGGPVRMRLGGTPAVGVFRGLLELEVPFRAMKDHELRQERFLTWVSRDEVCARAPFIFVFTPAPVEGCTYS